MEQLKKLYEDYFYVGVACERISERFTTHEIGNPAKEALMADQFSSMTCANELKPAYNMGFKSPEAKEDYLPFVINPAAKAMLDWAKENKLRVRGHVMVWHSQCPKEVFCKGYEPVTFPTDPEVLKEKPFMKHFEKLNPVCYVDRETMLKRLRTYIYSLTEYMYKEGYMNTIYAWDVVNEAIELEDKTPTGLRNTYWYQVIGEDFMYFAFRYAHDAVQEISVKYASQYGVDPTDKEALRKIQPSLFYNDYNEFIPSKKEAIIAALTRETSEHGSIIGEGLIDGIGMQGHLSDNNDLEEYKTALYDYGKLVSEVHVTELDVKCTCADANREYYQAVFYKALFEMFVQAKKDGINLTSVTVWGLTDDNSWIRGADPLLFRGDLSPKKSHDALCFVFSGESLGDPLEIIRDLSDRIYNFEGWENPEEQGFKMRGFGKMELLTEGARSGSKMLAIPQRFGDFCNISFNVTDFVGQTVKVGAYVKSPAPKMVLMAEKGGKDEVVAECETNGEWSYMTGEYSLPSDVYSMYFYFATAGEKEGTASPMFVDEITVDLVGMKESFEKEKHIAQIRGIGHLPVFIVTDAESVDGKSKSLQIMRQEKEATMKFGVTAYAGMEVEISAYVKTSDSVVRMGIEKDEPVVLSEIETKKGEWNLITATLTVPTEQKTVEIFIETDGTADYYVDDIFVKPVK